MILRNGYKFASLAKKGIVDTSLIVNGNMEQLRNDFDDDCASGKKRKRKRGVKENGYRKATKQFNGI